MTNGDTDTATRGKVILDISMSLDGCITAPDDDVEHPLGRGGQRLHDWLFDAKTDRDAEVLDEWLTTSGAVILGRRTYDLGVGAEDGWEEGAGPLGQVPVFVLTHDPPAEAAKGGSVFTFVTDGIEAALSQARATAGAKNVTVMGAKTAQQFVKAGLLDEIQIHLVPVLLGNGIRLFDAIGTEPIELEHTRVIATPGVTHLRFRVVE